jgi:hypothetical protein
MKTKNLFIACALFLLGLANANSAMAENTDNVTLNLKFKPVQTITVNPTQETVDFLYQTETDYTDGVTLAVKTKHLKVFSTGGFVVNVKASAANFTSGNTNLTIPVGDVSVKASKSVGNPRTYAVIDVAKALSTTDQILIQSNGGGKDLEFDVEYDNTEDAAEAYIDGYNVSHVDGDGATVFTTTLTYTITTI